MPLPHEIERMSDEEILEKFPRSEAAEILLKRYENYLFRLAQTVWENALGRDFVPFEDLLSTARMGLAVAANIFDHSKNTSFLTLLVHVVNNLLLKEVARYMPIKFGYWKKASEEEKEKFAQMLNSLVGWEEASHAEDEEESISIEDIPDPRGEDEWKALTDRWLIRASIRRLPPLEQQVITLAYGLNGGEPMSFAQIAQILGYSPQHIKNVHRRAIARLRGWFRS
jgi:RNA polymerase sigma factor (sigma-70 family)